MTEYRTPSDIHPCLTYANAPEAIGWLCRAFGFVRCLVVPGDNGTIRHSELRLGTGVVMVSSPRPGRAPPSTSGANCATLSVYVADPDKHLAVATAAGAKITQPLCDEAYGARGYSACDLEGHNWYFGNYRPGAHWENPDEESACG
ncbi:hypothetical protein LPB72_17230 [Hydrogenophaga crassostreae]|uniref:Glyoxalase/fosfomycin resistance/dioxygenase domain-containing protein n=1 Tax=Hydrogenophaga crassostreae TaxID=1763535 RepID=A0A167GVL6_9BURK|nr:VOC family protein [Hydrogenophaga crassostreae]AOW12747.1 hypothetical protein LPB072_07735 [Hydrogenophaga crassostreae]OAD39936.1 hypothetical protein LPB72_17230 [Hydrogenophaga crassostreae]